ncbi:MAG: carbohydrate ABC transporter permease [Lachnospiraceae bacterium]|nr:carbohydrate ABC transporter permease [Lachnospiraceae bacterium]
MKTVRKNKWKNNGGQIALHIAFTLIAIIYIAPLMIVISASFTSESVLNVGGFGLFPKEFTTDAYRMIFAKPQQIIDSYKTTITYSVIGTVLSITVMGLLAYPLARKNFRPKGIINFLVLFTMLFHGGLVPSYLVNTRYLHLDNTVWIYILPTLVTAYNVFVIKAGFIGIPDELYEAAKVDGASEYFIFFKIVVPLSKATLATVGFLRLVSLWNDWMTSSIYINKADLFSLQYILQKILKEAKYMQSLVNEGVITSTDLDAIMPVESLRYALAMVMAGPMLIVFPFFQKYFVKGMVVGAVKG